MAKFLEDPGTFDEFIDTFLEGKGQSSHELHFETYMNVGILVY